jgi:toxin ParE1/3/4
LALVPPLTLKVTASAAEQLRSIENYIREHNPAAAVRVGDAMQAAFELLRRHPHAGRPGRSVDTREKSVTRYPYVIVYGFPPQDAGSPVVLGVFHTAQNERKI